MNTVERVQVESYHWESLIPDTRELIFSELTFSDRFSLSLTSKENHRLLNDGYPLEALVHDMVQSKYDALLDFLFQEMQPEKSGNSYLVSLVYSSAILCRYLPDQLHVGFDAPSNDFILSWGLHSSPLVVDFPQAAALGLSGLEPLIRMILPKLEKTKAMYLLFNGIFAGDHVHVFHVRDRREWQVMLTSIIGRGAIGILTDVFERFKQGVFELCWITKDTLKEDCNFAMGEHYEFLESALPQTDLLLELLQKHGIHLDWELLFRKSISYQNASSYVFTRKLFDTRFPFMVNQLTTAHVYPFIEMIPRNHISSFYAELLKDAPRFWSSLPAQYLSRILLDQVELKGVVSVLECAVKHGVDLNDKYTATMIKTLFCHSHMHAMQIYTILEWILSHWKRIHRKYPIRRCEIYWYKFEAGWKDILNCMHSKLDVFIDFLCQSVQFGLIFWSDDFYEYACVKGHMSDIKTFFPKLWDAGVRPNPEKLIYHVIGHIHVTSDFLTTQSDVLLWFMEWIQEKTDFRKWHQYLSGLCVRFPLSDLPRLSQYFGQCHKIQLIREVILAYITNVNGPSHLLAPKLRALFQHLPLKPKQKRHCFLQIWQPSPAFLAAKPNDAEEILKAFKEFEFY
jgi:hypothetical protein